MASIEVVNRSSFDGSTLVFFREPQKFLIFQGTMEKNITLRVSYKWFLKRGALLYNETFPVLVVPLSYKFYQYQTVYKKVKFISTRNFLMI